MRSHAKSAGSSRRLAEDLGCAVRGATVSCRKSSEAEGSSAPSLSRLSLALAIASLALLALAPSAGAKGVVGFFGSSASGTGAGEFSSEFPGPGGIAVNQAGNDATGAAGAAAGDVYIVDRGNNRVEQFSASGVFKRAFGLDVGGAGVDVCASSCSAGTSSPDNGGMSSPQGVAVDQATGLLYVTDQGNSRIDVFSAGGVFQGAFGQDVDATTAGTGFEFCPAADTCQAGASATTDIAGAFGFGLGYLAVAPSGNVLVADRSNRRVDQFTPTVDGSGKVTAVAFTRAYGWNVAASGDSGDTAEGEFEICATTCQQGGESSDLGGFGSAGPTAIAVDSTGRAYVTDPSNNRVQGFDSTGNPLLVFASAQLSGEPAPLDVAVDRSSHRVFLIKTCDVKKCPPGSFPPPFSTEEDRVLEFDSNGNLLASHATGAGIFSATGLAESQASGQLYMTVNEGSSHGAFILNSPLVAPVASVDPGSGFTHTGTTATFTGTVNPTGFPTGYHFEYSTNGSTWQSAPSSDVTLPFTDSSAHAVSREVTGLIGSQLYHVRLTATKLFAAGAATSAETTFTTDSAPPLISAAAVDWQSITTTAATIKAEVNPENQDTTYQFEYVTEEQFEASGFSGASVSPVGGGQIGHGGEARPVAVELSGLQPAVSYRVRMAATNSTATVYSPVLDFSTYPDYGPLPACPNEEFRAAEPSAALPDCRAYEQVSPVDKNGLNVAEDKFNSVAASGGDAATFFSVSGLPGGVRATDVAPYISRRQGGEWVTKDLFPPLSFGTNKPQVDGFTADLDHFFISAGFFAGNPIKGRTFLDRGPDDSFGTMAPYTFTASYKLAGASADGAKAIFEASVPGGNGSLPVTSGPVPVANRANLYLLDRDTGQLTLVGVLPADEGDMAPVEGSFAGPFDWWRGTDSSSLSEGGVGGTRNTYYIRDMHAVSSTGDEAFFTAAGTGQIYLRRGLTTASPETVKVSASQRTTPDPNGEKPAIFQFATPSGGKAFFTSCQKLTDDSTAVSTADNACDTSSQGQDLYVYDAKTDHLTDLTVDSDDPQGADVKGVVGVSDNGDYVYFAANGDLDGSGPASPGTCSGPPANGFTFTGECSLYLWHDGDIRLVARLDVSGVAESSDAANWAPIPYIDSNRAASAMRPGQVSADGATLLFRSRQRLAAYDNQANCGANASSCPELYRFDADSDTTVCVSCNPTGAPPVSTPRLPSGTDSTAGLYPTIPRTLSSTGDRVFFETTEKLTAADVNGRAGCSGFRVGINLYPSCTDVYEWEAPNVGSCPGSATSGCLYLLSAGATPNPSYLLGASVSGDDAFFFTFDPLVPQDGDQLTDVYDARVGGGLASQHPSQAPPCDLNAGACEAAGTSASRSAGAGTAAFQGPGDPTTRPTRCPKGKRKVRRGGKIRCLSGHRQGRHHRANANRRAHR